jgi:hypothetical protein
MSSPPTEPDDGYGTHAVAGYLEGLVIREARRILNRILSTIMLGTALLVLVVSLTVVGVWRMATALTTVCTHWLGDPILADVLAGSVLLLIAAAILLRTWGRMRR